MKVRVYIHCCYILNQHEILDFWYTYTQHDHFKNNIFPVRRAIFNIIFKNKNLFPQNWLKKLQNAILKHSWLSFANQEYTARCQLLQTM